ncbi:MAG: polymer-forming cytoskeletal protein [Actinobacteria bacterium]|nr:polymer-forming cytoskeletal protein [Actinomycetota bacterium]
MTVVGNLRTTGDIVIEGTVEGDIRAHLLTVGESATIRGEVIAELLIDLLDNAFVDSLTKLHANSRAYSRTCSAGLLPYGYRPVSPM